MTSQSTLSFAGISANATSTSVTKGMTGWHWRTERGPTRISWVFRDPNFPLETTFIILWPRWAPKTLRIGEQCMHNLWEVVRIGAVVLIPRNTVFKQLIATSSAMPSTMCTLKTSSLVGVLEESGDWKLRRDSYCNWRGAKPNPQSDRPRNCRCLCERWKRRPQIQGHYRYPSNPRLCRRPAHGRCYRY